MMLPTFFAAFQKPAPLHMGLEYAEILQSHALVDLTLVATAPAEPMSNAVSRLQTHAPPPMDPGPV